MTVQINYPKTFEGEDTFLPNHRKANYKANKAKMKCQLLLYHMIQTLRRSFHEVVSKILFLKLTL